jgi:tetratricopeptide (TPR) repeat protein
MRGDACYNQGQYARAADCYETGLRRAPANSSLESKFGLAIVRSGNVSRGMHRLHRAVATQPGAPELHDRLVLALVWLNRIEQAAEATETKLHAVEHPAANDFLRAASLWAKANNWSRAIDMLQAGLAKYPRNPELRRGLEEATHGAHVSRIVSSAK